MSKTLQNVANYAVNKMQSFVLFDMVHVLFDMVHVFKTLRLIEMYGHVSREALCDELELGEGATRTLMKHLKTQNFIESTNAGTKMSKNGNALFNEFLSSIPYELSLSKCSLTLGKHNYAVLVKQMGSTIKSGIEQRDASIKMGASGVTKLLFCSWTRHSSFRLLVLMHYGMNFGCKTIDRDATSGRWRCNYNRN